VDYNNWIKAKPLIVSQKKIHLFLSSIAIKNPSQKKIVEENQTNVLNRPQNSPCVIAVSRSSLFCKTYNLWNAMHDHECNRSQCIAKEV